VGTLCLLVRIRHGNSIQGLFALRTYNLYNILQHVSHLESTETGTLWVDSAKIKLLSFLHKILLFDILLSVFIVSFGLIGAHQEHD
jgi:hypothetical protein